MASNLKQYVDDASREVSLAQKEVFAAQKKVSTAEKNYDAAFSKYQKSSSPATGHKTRSQIDSASTEVFAGQREVSLAQKKVSTAQKKYDAAFHIYQNVEALEGKKKEFSFNDVRKYDKILVNDPVYQILIRKFMTTPDSERLGFMRGGIKDLMRKMYDRTMTEQEYKRTLTHSVASGRLKQSKPRN